MDVSSTTWLVTMAVLLAVIVADLFIVGRNPREPSMREATGWVVLYVSLAVVFGIGVGWPPAHSTPASSSRVAHRVQPVDRQPVRLRDHHEPVRGASAVSADRSARGDRPRVDLPWVVHRRRRGGDLVVQLDLLSVRRIPGLDRRSGWLGMARTTRATTRRTRSSGPRAEWCPADPRIPRPEARRRAATANGWSRRCSSS